MDKKNKTKLISTKLVVNIGQCCITTGPIHKYSRLFLQHQSKIQTAIQCYFRAVMFLIFVLI